VPTSASPFAVRRIRHEGAARPSREFVAFGSGDAWRRWLAEGSDPETQDWDILFKLSRSNFRPRNGTYDPVQQQLVDLRPAGAS
jgi:hypothetical protein